MNPRQRRGMLFIAVAVLGAFAVFFAVLSYVNDIESQIGDRVDAWVVSKDVPAYTTVTEENLEQVEIPKRWIPDGAVRDLSVLVGTVSAADLTKGTLLQQSSLVPSPNLQTGQREVAMLIDADSGVAGKVRSGDRVDVWANFSLDAASVGSGRAKVIAQDMLVLDVGIQTSAQRVSSAGALMESEVVPVTFAAAESQVKALIYAKTFSSGTTLTLRPPGDSTLIKPRNKTYQETFGGGVE